MFNVQSTEKVLSGRLGMTDNKLQLNEHKTEAMQFDSPKIQNLAYCSVHLPNHYFLSDSVRNLGFYLDEDLSVAEHNVYQ